jgi:hypothetical protein
MRQKQRRGSNPAALPPRTITGSDENGETEVPAAIASRHEKQRAARHGRVSQAKAQAHVRSMSEPCQSLRPARRTAAVNAARAP